MRLTLALAIILLFSGCAFSPYISSFGTSTTQSHSGVQVIITDTENIKARKIGTATCHNLLGIAAWGNCSIEAAMKDGGITRVKNAQTKIINAMWLYTSSTTIVEGE